MEKEKCDLSCDPANPRRYEVPGPHGVKYVTEDCPDAGNQASETVNATGKKKLIQQALHPSLFTRVRSASLGSKPQIHSDIGTAHNRSTENIECSDRRPPEWQRIPVARNSKRKKMSDSPSPEAVKTNNRYTGLPIDQNESEQGYTEKKPNKPPPILLYGIEDVNKLIELLGTVTTKEQFTFKIVNRNQLRINTVDVEVYKKIISKVRENGLIGHTFTCKDQRCYRVVIKNLHHTTPHSAIEEEIEKTGNKVKGEIINVKYGPDKIPTSTFFVNIAQGPNNKAVKQISKIYHQSITIEDPKKRRTIPQCQRCQQYGHSKNYCMRPYRCVKCALAHKTSDCPKKDRNTPAQCALCQGAHPANYKGCNVYKEILARRMPRTNHNPKKPVLIVDQTRSDLIKTNDKNYLYSDVLKRKYEELAPPKEHPQPQPPPNNRLEELLIKQSEKFETILQQMSALVNLITKLVTKLD